MSTDFTNSIILPENLPQLEGVEYNPVDRKYIRILYLRYLIWTGIVVPIGWLLPAVLKEKSPDFWPWAWAALVVAVWIASMIITAKAFPYRGYLIREKDIAYQRGLIRYKLTSIPFNRIQHVELNQGIIAKRMGLATLKIYTAGSSADDLEIPGLPVATAGQIREFLTGKISADE
jgi:hypothetical protein